MHQEEEVIHKLKYIHHSISKLILHHLDLHIFRRIYLLLSVLLHQVVEVIQDILALVNRTFNLLGLLVVDLKAFVVVGLRFNVVKDLVGYVVEAKFLVLDICHFFYSK